VDAQPPLKTERRRSSRFPAVIPVHVKWQEPTGKILKEAAYAKEVNWSAGHEDLPLGWRQLGSRQESEAGLEII
jgi:hypothetical protein